MSANASTKVILAVLIGNGAIAVTQIFCGIYNR